MSNYDADQYITKMRERIEELEQDRDFWSKTAKGYKDDYNECIRTGKCADGHHITTDQIRAAWEYVGEEAGCIDNDYESFTLALLNEFNIERCKGCKGNKTRTRLGPDENGSFIEACPDCNGEGWRVTNGT